MDKNIREMIAACRIITILERVQPIARADFILRIRRPITAPDLAGNASRAHGVIDALARCGIIAVEPRVGMKVRGYDELRIAPDAAKRFGDLIGGIYPGRSDAK